MQFARSRSAEIIILALMILTTLPLTTSQKHTYNITAILSKFPEFSTFSQYLTLTHLSSEINKRSTITVCAVDNSAMSQLLHKGLPLDTIRNRLSLHIVLDYFDAKKLHQLTNGSVQAATMYQSSGFASGSSGIINITDLKGGKVGFSAGESGDVDAYFVKSITAIPYELGVIQISAVLSPHGGEAPSPQPSRMNLTAVMSEHGCKVFADTLLRDANANRTFVENVGSGLTVFCPLDNAFKQIFSRQYKNLSKGEKDSLLEFHGVPVYLSFSMLKSNNGVMNTLATEGGSNYQFSVQNDGDQVTLKTKIMTARIMGKLLDQEPLAIFALDKVLLPRELFKSALAPAPAPAMSPAESPKGYSESPSPSIKRAPSPSPKSSRRHLSPPAPDAEDSTDMDSPAESPDEEEDDLADIITDKNVAPAGLKGGRFITRLFYSLLLAILPLA